MKKCTIGGQAVLEGVMMKAPNRMAIAVRQKDGKIVVNTKDITSVKDKYSILKWPILRGIVNFVETMIMGIQSLMDSAELYGEESEENKPSKFESWVSKKTGKRSEDVMVFFALLVALGFAVLLFIIGPALLTGLIGRTIDNNLVKSLIEGVIRLSVFLIYILAISRMKDIKRVFEYHGAEHKTIHCYEHEKELTVENAREFTTLHPRCGTAFLLIVMVIGIVVFSFLKWDNMILRLVMKLLLLPIVAGISYEILKWAGASDSKLVKIIMYPGLMLQRLTTKEPDDEQLEVAIYSFLAATGVSTDQGEVLESEHNEGHKQSQGFAG
ncbi:MAG: DUF1385 domain-containing protein [Clostridiales bacterium]|mgnify:CR=1 FL=1|nr:DUF1385 domain-containing protein [Clostridiales bacterium]